MTTEEGLTEEEGAGERRIERRRGAIGGGWRGAGQVSESREPQHVFLSAAKAAGLEGREPLQEQIYSKCVCKIWIGVSVL